MFTHWELEDIRNIHKLKNVFKSEPLVDTS